MASLLERLSSFLNEGLLGQGDAVREFSTTVALALNGRPKPERTKGMIFLAGPTGTGKTEMVRLTARFLYGPEMERHLHRFDMAEYQHPDSLHRLLGAPGQPALLGMAIDRLNEAAGADGTAFLLFDEIEKAYVDLVTILLSFDAARTTTNDGVTRDLSRIFVVITSNVGSARAADLQHAPYSALRDEVLIQAEKRFRKETLARFDARIVMNRLGYDVQREITRGLLAKETRVQAQYLQRPIEVSPEVLNFLIREGFTPDLGARNLRATVERQVGRALLPWWGIHDDDQAEDRFSRTLVLREDRAQRQLVAERAAERDRSRPLREILHPTNSPPCTVAA
jgi:ATP-dependent Clp protease ATP-binding subunit ClpA